MPDEIIGRQELSYPELGKTGGATLNDQNKLMMETLSDNANSRFTTVSGLGDGLTHEYKHNLGSSLADLTVNIYTDVAGVYTLIPYNVGFTIAEKTGEETTTIEVTNNTGGSVDIAITVSQDAMVAQQLRDFDDSVTPEDGQAWVWSDVSGKYVLGASGDASFKLQGITGQDMTVKAGYIILSDGRELRTAAAADLTVDLSGYGDDTYYFYIDLEALAAPVVVGGRTLYNVENDDIVALTGLPTAVDLTRYIPLGGGTKSTNWSNLFSSAFRRHDNLDSWTLVNITNADSPYTAKIGEWLITDTTGGPITVNMPALGTLATAKEKYAYIKFSDCASNWNVNAVTVTPAAGESLDGQAADETSVLDVQDQNVTFQRESSSNWCLDTNIQPTESTDNTIKNDITSPTYEFVADDLNTVMQLTENTANNITMTIPSGLGLAGATLTVIKMGTGTITWAAGGGVTLNSADSLVDMGTQYAVCTAIQTSANVWVLTGDRA